MIETSSEVNSQSDDHYSYTHEYNASGETGTRLVQDMFKSRLGSEPVVQKNINSFMVDQETKKKATWVWYY